MKKIGLKAFSILEIFITITLLFILFYIAVPKFTFLNRFVLQNEVDKLFTIASFLQQRAITCATEQQLVFDLKENSYSYNNKIYKLPLVVKFGYLKGVLGPPSNPEKEVKEAITFKGVEPQKSKMSFYSDGKVQPGTIYLIDSQEKSMMAVTFPVSQISFVRKYKYLNNKWICLK